MKILIEHAKKLKEEEEQRRQPTAEAGAGSSQVRHPLHKATRVGFEGDNLLRNFAC
jgi:hypothetical protein